MCVSLVTHKPFLTKITFTCRKTLLFCSCCYSLNLFARWREEKCHFILNWISFFGGPPSLDVVPQQYLLVSCVLIYSFDCIFVLCLQFLTCATHKKQLPFFGLLMFLDQFPAFIFLGVTWKDVTVMITSWKFTLSSSFKDKAVDSVGERHTQSCA